MKQFDAKAKEFEARCLAVQHEFDIIYNSQCWKMTYPLRWMLDLIKANKCGKLVHKVAWNLNNLGLKATVDKSIKYIQKRMPYKVEKAEKRINGFSELVRTLEKENGVKIGLKEKLNKYDRDVGKKVLFVSHEFDLTGAPIALGYMIDYFKVKGYSPLVISPNDGEFSRVLNQNGTPTIVYPRVYCDGIVRNIAQMFDLIVVNTIIGGPVIDQLAGNTVPVLWWIHEAKTSYFVEAVNNMPRVLTGNIAVYVVGRYAYRILKKYRPDYEAKNLLYYVPDYTKTDNADVYELPSQAKDKKVFLSVGVLEERKGQNVIVEALLKLDSETVKKGYYVFVGRKWYPPIWESLQKLIKAYPDNVLYIEKLDRQNMMNLYKKIDCFVCSSLDDPMPIVVTEALMFSKMVICSENTGSASILKKEKCGLVYKNNDPLELAQYIGQVIKKDRMTEEECHIARCVYEKYFSRKAFEYNVDIVLDKLISMKQDDKSYQLELSHLVSEDGFNGTVSVVIPTYNAGKQFRLMLERLRSQKHIKNVEIVVVDSGSKDSTINLCQKYKVVLKQIDQSEFSHSYARNLGAKIARGDILLFMTQDALPLDEEWMYQMILPIIKGEVVATSCKEQCPEGTDLYYRISSWYHAQYIGVDKGNQINKYCETDNVDILRRKGSLNDVSTAIHAKIFDRNLYRHSYAEDLDMGIRLLKSGYQIALLGSTSVIHAHNRTAGYYLKRAFVEKMSFGDIDHRWKTPPEDPNVMADRVVCAFELLEAALKEACETIPTTCSRVMFFDSMNKIMHRHLSQCGCIDADRNGSLAKDEIMWKAYSSCRDLLDKQNLTGKDRGLFVQLIGYLQTVITPYVVSCKDEEINCEMQESIYSALTKHLGVCIGLAFGSIEKHTELYIAVQELSKGV